MSRTFSATENDQSARNAGNDGVKRFEPCADRIEFFGRRFGCGHVAETAGRKTLPRLGRRLADAGGYVEKPLGDVAIATADVDDEVERLVFAGKPLFVGLHLDERVRCFFDKAPEFCRTGIGLGKHRKGRRE